MRRRLAPGRYLIDVLAKHPQISGPPNPKRAPKPEAAAPANPSTASPPPRGPRVQRRRKLDKGVKMTAKEELEAISAFFTSWEKVVAMGEEAVATNVAGNEAA